MPIHIHRAERLWLGIGVGMLLLFIAIVVWGVLAEGIVPPSHVQVLDPTRISRTPPFDRPGLRRLANGQYEAYYVAHIFSFDPQHVIVPTGSHVTFYVTSEDVEHGFIIPGTDVNTMVTPGWVSTVAYTFRKPGRYLLLCNEYCGAGHQLMASGVVVR